MWATKSSDGSYLSIVKKRPNVVYGYKGLIVPVQVRVTEIRKKKIKKGIK